MNAMKMTGATDNLPEKQRGLIFEEAGGEIRLRDDLPIPEPGPDEILLKLMYSGVCHTDLHVWLGEFYTGTLKLPLVGGHEGAGYVAKLGSNVRNFKIGDRAGIKWVNSTCLTCEMCKRGFDNNCAEALQSGFNKDGTFQQYALVKATEAPRIPDGLDMAVAAPLLCAGVTVYKALKVSEVKAGEIVAITGAGGGLGSLAVQYAKAMGMLVLALDAGIKKDHCLSLGADFFLDPFAGPNYFDEIARITEGGPHGVVNVATSAKAMDDSCRYVREHGTVVIVALPKDGKVTFDILPAVFRTIQIKCSYVGTRQDMDEALKFAARGAIKVPIEILPMDQLMNTYDRLTKGTLNGRVVLDLWK